MSRANKRVQKELERLVADPIPGIVIVPQEDSSIWIAAFVGGEGTLYEGEEFQLQFRFSADYPIDPPEVVFLDPVPVHPHIYSNGHICLSILSDEWSPALTSQAVCLSIVSMLSSCTERVPPPDNDSYVRRAPKSPKKTLWVFHDNSV
jgi:ubiquitin-conjugating enzyme E2 W